jgi:hypothetical protein
VLPLLILLLLLLVSCAQVLQTIPDLHVLVVSHENITNNWCVVPLCLCMA